MINANNCWGCINCLQSKVRNGAELTTGNYGNCLKESSPINIGKSKYAQVSKTTCVSDCTHYKPKPNNGNK